MSEKLYQQAVAKFLNTISNEQGWWYRIPINGFDEKHTTDNVFPHMGTLFGINDYFMCYVLIKINVVKFNKNEKSESYKTSPL